MPDGVNLGSAYGTITIDATGTEKGFDDAKRQVREFESSLTKAGLVAGAAGGILTGLAVKATMTAARTEELGVVVANIATQTGNSMEEVNKQIEAVKDLGITTQVADRVLMKFMQNEMDLTQATKLARLAQDAAVISMEDSSQALDGILHGILTLQPEVLRYRGIMVNLEQEYRQWAIENGRTLTSLTMLEKQNIALTATLEQGQKIAGTYDAAMGTAGKQLRSMSRHVEELQSALGEHLLPVMSQLVTTGTDVLKWLRALPEPVQRTGIQVAGFGGAMLTVSGLAVSLGPKLLGLVGAFQGVAAGIGLSSAALYGPLGLLAGLAVLVMHLQNVKKAHQEEAAKILESSESYVDYVKQLESAGIKSEALTEELYDQAKAAGEASDAFDYLAYQKATESVEEFARELAQSYSREWPRWQDETDRAQEELALFTEGIQSSIGTLTDMELMVMSSDSAVRRWGQGLGMQGKTLDDFVSIVGEAVDREQDLRQVTEWATAAVDPWVEREREAAAALEDTATAVEKTAEEKQALLNATKELSDKVTSLRDAYEGFFGTLARGAVGIRNLDAAAAKSADKYQDSLEELDKKAANVYSSVKMNFEASLPKPTTVSERLKMTEDAWDEWALRVDTIISDGVASPWYQMLQDMGYTKPPDQGVREWASDLKTAILEGEIPELLNTNSQAWIENAAEQKRAQADATAAYQGEVAKRKAAIEQEKADLQAAREEQLAQEAEARNRAVLELSLSLAEQSNLLAAWSEQQFGPDFSQVADSASEVLALLDSGMLEMDGTLKGIIESQVAGIQTMLDTTGGAAEETKKTLDEVLGKDWVADRETAISQAFDVARLIDPVSADVDKIEEEIGGVVPDDAFGALLTNFDTANEGILTGVSVLSEETLAALDGIEVEAGTLADYLINDLSIAALGAVQESAGNVEDDWTEGMRAMRESVTDVLDELEKIPDETVITVKTEGGGSDEEADEDTDPTKPPPKPKGKNRETGGPVMAGESYIVGERGPEVFSPTTAGVIWPNDVVREMTRLIETLKASGGRQPGNGSQNVTMYGPVQLGGVRDGRGLLQELSKLQQVGG